MPLLQWVQCGSYRRKLHCLLQTIRTLDRVGTKKYISLETLFRYRSETMVTVNAETDLSQRHLTANEGHRSDTSNAVSY